MKPRILCAALALVAVPANQAQAPNPRPEFDVASIKPNVNGGPYVFAGQKSPGNFAGDNETLLNLIQVAYGRVAGQTSWLPFFKAPGEGVPILGGPDWIRSERYDVTAKWNAPANESPDKNQPQMRLMLQVLLEQRFQLRVHRETRDLPVYEMTLESPRKLTQGACTTFDPANLPPTGQQTPSYCGASHLGRKGPDWTLDGTGMKMADLADTLSFLIGTRTIVDKTGFARPFDAHLRWTPSQGEFGATDVPAAPEDTRGSIFAVLREQLGLKLKAGRGPVEVIVIDHAEKPSPN